MATLAAARPPAFLTPRLARRIALLVLDVDGVLTDGGLWYGPRGETQKRFHVRDGHGIKLLQATGIEVAVISGRQSPAVKVRCRELGVRQVLQGIDDKGAALDRLLRRRDLSETQVACMGDDTPDIPLFVRVAFAVRRFVILAGRHEPALEEGVGLVEAMLVAGGFLVDPDLVAGNQVRV